MNIEKIMEEIDVLYSQQKVEEVEALLLEKIAELKNTNQIYPALSLMNELLGIYREKGDSEKGQQCCQDVLYLFEKHQLKRDENFGTTLLNVATAQRSFGNYEKAKEYYNECMEIYRDRIPPNDYRYASLYNNLNLLCCETGDFDQAIDHLEKSLAILAHHKGVEVQIATANTSLAQIYSGLENLELAEKHIKVALDLFSNFEDYHYSGALATAANIAYLKGRYEDAASLYQNAMDEIEKYLGKTENYKMLEENLEYVRSFIQPKESGTASEEGSQEESALPEDEVPEVAEPEVTEPEEELDTEEPPTEEEETMEAVEVESSSPEISEEEVQVELVEKDAPEQEEPSPEEAPAETQEVEVDATSRLTGLELSKAFYLEYGAPMIQTHFPHYVGIIAVGLVGEGSEALGFDDKLSEDHDFGPGFCLWLPDDLYRNVGQNLQKHYNSLPKTYKGVKTFPTETAGKRVGVFSILDFYVDILGALPETDLDWVLLEDSALAKATNGEVFRDDLGEFTKIRTLLAGHYPPQVRLGKIAEKAHEVSQKGQYNYQRMLNRGDFVTARIILSEFMRNTMELVFLLNKEYAPFYKWTYKKMKTLPLLSHLARPIHEINGLAIDDKKIIPLIEWIVAELIMELEKQGLIEDKEKGNFLDDYVGEMLTMKIEDKDSGKEELVQKMVDYEWKAFDKVQGMDGRASCQDDHETFEIMRSSQFLAWSMDLLESYLIDFETALSEGRNLVTEKYAFMMKSTDPDNFKEMESKLPQISPSKAKLIEKAVTKQMELVLVLKPKYPKFVNQGRSLKTSEDNLYNTSYETYLRGELSSYSEKTVGLYFDLLMDNEKKGLNTAKIYMENVAFQYGYPDLETAEDSIKSGF